MTTLTPSRAAISLAQYLCRSPGKLMDALKQSLSARFTADRITRLSQGGTAFALNDGSQLRIWPDLVMFNDPDGTNSCWFAAEWEESPEAVLLDILAYTEQAGASPTKLEVFEKLLNEVVALLKVQGIDASVEHPYCIQIPLPGNERALCAGAANVEWGYDHTIGGVLQDDTLPGLAEGSTVMEIAEWLARAYHHHLAR